MINDEKLNELLLINNLIKQSDFFTIMYKIIPIIKSIISQINVFSIDIETEIPYSYDDDNYNDYNMQWDIKNINVGLKNIEKVLKIERILEQEQETIKGILFEYYELSESFDIECYIERKEMSDDEFLAKIIETMVVEPAMIERVKQSTSEKSDDVYRGTLFTTEAKNEYISSMNKLMRDEFCECFYNIINDYKKSSLESLNFYYENITIKFKGDTSGINVYNFNDEKSRKLMSDHYPDRFPTIEIFLNHSNYFSKLRKLNDFNFLEKICILSGGVDMTLKDREQEKMIDVINSFFKQKDTFLKYIIKQERESILKNITPEIYISVENVKKKRM